ncbi:MAG TPA: MarR family winged helix-turn-helix transcriptional regulator [Gemmatimonadaceae bacterium]
MYDTRLAEVGLTTTQFSILRSLDRATGPVPLSELADEQVFERTSLYRALEPLRRQRLIAIRPGRGRAKVVALTALGAKRVAAALPHWEKAQDAFLGQYGSSKWGALAAQLVGVVDTARVISGRPPDNSQERA